MKIKIIHISIKIGKLLSTVLNIEHLVILCIFDYFICDRYCISMFFIKTALDKFPRYHKLPYLLDILRKKLNYSLT